MDNIEMAFDKLS